MNNKTVLLFGIFLIPVYIFSCKPLFFFSSGVNFDEVTFEKEFQLWKDNDINNYSFSFYSGNHYCNPVEVKITIQNDTVTYEALNNYSGDYNSINSMADVFMYIKNLKTELEINCEKDCRYNFDMTYDKVYHFPLKMEVTTEYNSWYIDDEYHEMMRISEFTLLEVTSSKKK